VRRQHGRAMRRGVHIASKQQSIDGNEERADPDNHEDRGKHERRLIIGCRETESGRQKQAEKQWTPEVPCTVANAPPAARDQCRR